MSYQSGSALNGSSRYLGETFQSLGLVPGSYTQVDGNGVAIATVNVGSVLEPATWATMMIGFDLIGSAVRRRRANAIV